MLRLVTKRWIPLLCLCLIAASCRHHEAAVPKERDLVRIQSAAEQSNPKKKVILIVADSLMAQAIDRGVRQNKLPTFRQLIERGHYFKDMVSSFPTMSVPIDSSLLTGTYPDGHHVPGLTWYSQDDKKVIGYGSGPFEVLRRGVKPVLKHALIDLNGKHLNPAKPTLHEDLHRLGLNSGSINGLVYRGSADHRLTLPAPISEITSLPRDIPVKGPDFLAFGSLSNPLEGIIDLPDGPVERMGFTNRYAVETAKYLIRMKKLPDFLLVYLPDLDGKLHKKGPTAERGVVEMDRQLGSMLAAFGSFEQAISEAIILIAGDSGMSQVLAAEKNPVIQLPKLLNRYEVLGTGEAVKPTTEIVLGVNDTMAYVYSLKPETPLKNIADVLKTDSRIDKIAWKEGGWIHCLQGGASQTLKFKPGGKLVDRYRQKWTVLGHPEVMDLKLDNEKQTLAYGQYPDALRRMQGALDSHKANFLVITAKPGYELAEAGAPTHPGGGAHGGLDQSASLVPLIICGTEKTPEHLRIIDLKEYILDLLNPEKRR